MYGPTLTTYEWDNLLTDAQKQLLHQIVQQPMFDHKSSSYRHRFGSYRNGELYADPRVQSLTGYGDTPPSSPNPLITPIPNFPPLP